jgi:hypothetical protein
MFRGASESEQKGSTATSGATGMPRRVLIVAGVVVFGSSWTALTLSIADIQRLLAGERGPVWTDCVFVVAIIAIVVSVATIVRMMLREDRAVMARLDGIEQHGALCEEAFDILAEAADDRANLKRQLTVERSQNAAIVAAIVPQLADAIFKAAQASNVAVAQISSNVAPPESVAQQGVLQVCDNRATVKPRQPKKAATIKGRNVAKPADNRPQANLATVEEWAGECIVARPGYEIGATALYQSYCSWCDERKIIAVKQRSFGDRLTDLKYVKETRRTVWYQGVALKGATPELKLISSSES